MEKYRVNVSTVDLLVKETTDDIRGVYVDLEYQKEQDIKLGTGQMFTPVQGATDMEVTVDFHPARKIASLDTCRDIVCVQLLVDDPELKVKQFPRACQDLKEDLVINTKPEHIDDEDMYAWLSDLEYNDDRTAATYNPDYDQVTIVFGLD